MERTAQAFPCLWVSASPWLCAIPAVALSIHAEHSCRADSVWSQAECLGWPESIGDQCPGGPSPFHPFSFCGQPGQQLVAGISLSRGSSGVRRASSRSVHSIARSFASRLNTIPHCIRSGGWVLLCQARAMVGLFSLATLVSTTGGNNRKARQVRISSSPSSSRA